MRLESKAWVVAWHLMAVVPNLVARFASFASLAIRIAKESFADSVAHCPKFRKNLFRIASFATQFQMRPLRIADSLRRFAAQIRRRRHSSSHHQATHQGEHPGFLRAGMLISTLPTRADNKGERKFHPPRTPYRKLLPPACSGDPAPDGGFDCCRMEFSTLELQDLEF